MEIVYSTILLLSIEFISGKWMPELKFSPNFDQFQFYKSKSLDNVVYSSIDPILPNDFQWQSVASVSLPFYKVSYVIYGGNQHIQMDSKSAFPKKSSLVVICELSYTDIVSNFSNVQCNRVDTGEKNWYLGVATQAISLTDKEAVIVFCDPLWHVANVSEAKPSGKCYLNFINDRKVVMKTNIEFCRLSSTSFLACLGGFSVDLISTNKKISGIQMVVGMPYLPPYGSVKIVMDPFDSRTIIDPRNGIGKYFNFGYAVSMTTMSVAYASSPLSDSYGPNVTNVRQDIVLTSPDNVPFSSFGLSLKTLSIEGGLNHAVVIGAPFHSVKSIQNVGKTYLFCVSHDTKSSRLATELHGEKIDEFYGYALANIGDINGDGNDDMAVSSPFLRDDDSRGFVSIYTVDSKCGVKLLQILKSMPSNKIGIFGLSVTGGSDLDFNSWPDIVVLNSRSNSIELYASRMRFKAQCKFSLDNTYETEPLKRDDIIKIRMFMSLLDIRKNNQVNLEILSQFNLISQINPDYNTTERRFNLEAGKTTISIKSSSIAVAFFIKSLMHVKEMNLSMPVTVAYRLLENCSTKECNDLQFPLIDWDDCKIDIPVKKYICSINPTCEADLFVRLVDLQGSEVTYGHDVKFSRFLELTIFNAGPTEGKDINFKVSAYQNLRIHKIKAPKNVIFQEVISENQTEAICRLDQEEIDVNASAIRISIDLYFVDFKDNKKMKFVNNYISVRLFSDVSDPNISNNQARINYTFVYEPNVSFTGSPPKDTIIDPRNRSQLIRNGQRLPIDTIGPMLSHDYIIENSGNASITNMIVKIHIPMRTEDGFTIMYLFDRIRGVNKSEAVWMNIIPQVFVGSSRYLCNMPNKYVNPLKIIGFETHALHLKDIDIRQIQDVLHVIKRRSISEPKSAPISNVNDNSKISQGKMYRIPVEIVQCDRVGGYLKSPICAEIICNIPLLPPKKQAKVQINAWLWAYTFFKKQISDIRIYTTLQTVFLDYPEGVRLKWDSGKMYSQSQQFIFQNVKPKITHFKPWWPIIVGIVIGILILAILIVAMYKCGFFQRQKLKRRFKSSKYKKGVHKPIILHPGELQTASSVSSEAKVTSHSALIT